METAILLDREPIGDAYCARRRTQFGPPAGRASAPPARSPAGDRLADGHDFDL